MGECNESVFGEYVRQLTRLHPQVDRNVPGDHNRNQRARQLNVEWLRHLMAQPLRRRFAVDARGEENRRRHERDEVVAAAEDQSVAVRDEVLDVVGYEIVEEAARQDDEHDGEQAVERHLADEPERELLTPLAVLVRRECRERSQHHIRRAERVAGVLVHRRQLRNLRRADVECQSDCLHRDDECRSADVLPMIAPKLHELTGTRNKLNHFRLRNNRSLSAHHAKINAIWNAITINPCFFTPISCSSLRKA